MTTERGETFEEFRKSFSYGSRSDLSFKFLKNLDDAAASRFFQELLRKLGESYDTGDLRGLIDLAIDTQIDAYQPSPEASFQYQSGPFVPLAKPLEESTVGLITSSGHFVDDPEPLGVKRMTQEEAEARISELMKTAPVLSEIPATAEDVSVRHGGYDVRSTVRDRNVSFPRDRIQEMVARGRVAALAETLYSFPGATSQRRLLEELPGWVERISATSPDVIVLVPV